MLESRRSVRSTIAGLVFVVVAVSCLTHARAARSATAAVDVPRVSVVAVTSTASAGQTWNVSVRLDDVPEHFGLRFTAHERVTSLVRFRAILAGGSAGDWIDSPVSIARKDIESRAGTFTAQVPLVPSDVKTRDTLRLPGAGVYPVDIALTNGDSGQGRVLDTARTWLVVSDPTNPQPTQPVSLAWLVRVSTPPLRSADGTPDDAVADLLGAGRRLAGLADTLTSVASIGVPLTIAADPELLESWQSLARDDDPRADQFPKWSALLANPANEVLTGTYVRTDPARLVASGLRDALRTGLVDGHASLERVTDRAVDVGTLLVDDPTPNALGALHDAFVEHVVVPQDRLVPIDSELRYRPFRMTGASMLGLATDDDLTALLLDTSQTVAARVTDYTAALSVIAQQTATEPSEVVLRLPEASQQDPALVRILATAIARHPFIDVRTLDDVIANVPVGRDVNDQELSRSLRSTTEPAASRTDATTMRRADGHLRTLRELVGASDPRVVAGARALRLAIGTDASPDAATTATGRFDIEIRAVLGAITTPARTVTLTARRSRIPLTLTNGTGRTVKVRVEIRSPKLRFPNGASRIVTLAAQPRSSTVLFDVETLASGQFSAQVHIGSADGAVDIGSPTPLRVNSTVFGPIGTWLTFGAVGFLALWWAAHFLRSRATAKRADG